MVINNLSLYYYSRYIMNMLMGSVCSEEKMVMWARDDEVRTVMCGASVETKIWTWEHLLICIIPTSLSSPRHAAPPRCGRGASHTRRLTLLPTPQVSLQLDHPPHGPQPPATGTGPRITRVKQWWWICSQEKVFRLYVNYGTGEGNNFNFTKIEYYISSGESLQYFTIM